MNLLTVNYDWFEAVSKMSRNTKNDDEFIAFIDSSKSFNLDDQGICQVMWPWTLSMGQKVLFSLREERLLQHESLSGVREPTDWVNQMSVQYRKNGKT